MKTNAFKWTGQREKAAIMVAEDTLPDKEIAAQLGISERTLENWKAVSEFAARVNSHVAALREAILTKGIADKVNRVQRQNEDWQALRSIQSARAERAAFVAAGNRKQEAATKPALANAPLELFDEYPGMMTGRIVRVETPVKNGVKIEYQVDTGLLGELRCLETLTARELGQWVEKHDVEVRDAGIGDALERKLASLAARLATGGVPEKPDAG